MAELTCSVCGGVVPDLAAIYQGKVICFHCLAERYPELVARLVRYLTEFKGVRAE